jgi:hypothetical protein
MKVTKVEQKGIFRPQDVQVREPLVDDLINAERISGKSSGFEFLAAVAAAVCVFDGAAQPAEEVQRLTAKDFLELSDALDISDAPISPNGSSISSEKEGSEKEES